MTKQPLSREELYRTLDAWKFTPPDEDANQALTDELWARAGRVRAPGQILLSADAAGDLRKSAAHKDLAAALQGPQQIEVGHLQLDYFLLPPGKP